MKFKKLKQLWLLCSASLFCFLLFFGLFLLFSGRGAYHGAFEKKDFSFSLSLDTSGEQILSEKGTVPLPEGKQLLLLQNRERRGREGL